MKQKRGILRAISPAGAHAPADRQRKDRRAYIIKCNRLFVDQTRVATQTSDRISDEPEPLCPVVAKAREQPHDRDDGAANFLQKYSSRNFHID